MINVANILKKSHCNGHGTRYVIWVQGCNSRCIGCFNPEYQEIKTKTLMSIDTLAADILNTPEISGVTFSGGEPFLQAKELYQLARILRQNGLTVLVFTGLSEKYLEVIDDPHVSNLIENSDMIIAGEYDSEKPSNIPMIGSTNQTVMNLTGRLPDPKDDKIPRVEILCNGDTVTLSGFPTEKERAEFGKEFL